MRKDRHSKIRLFCYEVKNVCIFCCSNVPQRNPVKDTNLYSFKSYFLKGGEYPETVLVDNLGSLNDVIHCLFYLYQPCYVASNM